MSLKSLERFLGQGVLTTQMRHGCFVQSLERFGEASFVFKGDLFFCLRSSTNHRCDKNTRSRKSVTRTKYKISASLQVGTTREGPGQASPTFPQPALIIRKEQSVVSILARRTRMSSAYTRCSVLSLERQCGSPGKLNKKALETSASISPQRGPRCPRLEPGPRGKGCVSFDGSTHRPITPDPR